MTKISPASTRDRLLETAARLFFQNGYRAVGVDTITAESGIGKMTLYRHFDSKDDLIAAYLQDSNMKFWEEFENSMRGVPSPREKLTAFFKALASLVTKPNCYGCPFLNVTTEYPDRTYPGHKVALEHKESVRKRFRELAVQAGAKNPAALADQLFLLMDGAFMAVRMYGPRNPASHLVEAAETLINAQIK